jgi:hypothetical protein
MSKNDCHFGRNPVDAKKIHPSLSPQLLSSCGEIVNEEGAKAPRIVSYS